ncbi:MAG: hypothetical protein JWN34_4919 [Bryobacterales bacterium]|jgi:hypothetical protein|nr:hypothetical protein [Bryobacterales bacterium]
MPVQCPKCGSRYLRESRLKDTTIRARKLHFEAVLRCEDCKLRFVGSTLVLEDFLFAHCPTCRRMDLNCWSGKTHIPSAWASVKLALGAKRWRCEYCRINFASFRPRSEVFTFSRWQKLKVGDAVAEGRARLAEIETKSLMAREAQKSRARTAEAPENDEDE